MVEVREQIASQHARIVAMRRQGAGDENIVRERLAEQQLQLKEVLLYVYTYYQKSLDLSV